MSPRSNSCADALLVCLPALEVIYAHNVPPEVRTRLRRRRAEPRLGEGAWLGLAGLGESAHTLRLRDVSLAQIIKLVLNAVPSGAAEDKASQSSPNAGNVWSTVKGPCSAGCVMRMLPLSQDVAVFQGFQVLSAPQALHKALYTR